MRHSTLTGSDGPSQPRTIRLAGVLVASVLAALACGDSKIPTQQSAADDTTENDDGNAETTTPDDASSVSGYATTDGPVDPPDDSCFAQISAGGSYTCVLKVDGTLWCWGANVVGQLGLGNTESPVPAPTHVEILGSDVAKVATGRSHACALKQDNTLWCWGRNEYGQLGDGTRIDRPTPTRVDAFEDDIAQVAAGSRHTCAVKMDGTLWCWGTGRAVGDGTPAYESQLRPVQVATLDTNVANVSAQGMSTYAVTNDRELWSWGQNAGGQLGDGTTEDRLEPVRVTALDEVIQISGGACAVTADGTLWCWGDNQTGRVGDGTTVTPKPLPVHVAALDSIVEVSSSGFTCARDERGAVWCWGSNETGTIGNGTIDDTCEVATGCEMPVVQPVELTTIGLEIRGVSAGGGHACARARDDTIWCWGLNASGQLGDGTTNGEPCVAEPNVTVCQPSPVPVSIECR
jgi:alpha-tubulin suppressor-like RCC1 family protein